MSVDAVERLLAELVAARSVSSHHPALEDPPDQVLVCLRHRLGQVGASCMVEQVSARGRPVLLADIGPADAPFGAVLLGHVDTVPAVEPDRWSADPWTLQRRDGRWIGLGAADMKGFFACASEVLRRVRTGLRKRVRVIATTDEESGMQGMRGLVDRGLLPMAPVIIGEPTNGRPAGGCRGLVAFRIDLTGVEGHSSRPPGRGRVVDGLSRLLDAARSQECDWRSSAGPYGPATMNFGVINGGDAFNRLMSRVTIEGELRLPPGLAVRDAVAVLDRLVAAVGETGAAATVEILEQFCPRISPDGGRLPVMPFVCEASLLPAGQPFLIWGPGELGQAHRIDESLDTDAAARYCDDLEAWLMESCT